jgi:hypothetical protein
MKKIEDLYFTVAKISSIAQKRNVVHVLHTFFCQADDFFEKSVEQSRFEQMDFKQLTLTPVYPSTSS